MKFLQSRDVPKYCYKLCLMYFYSIDALVSRPKELAIQISLKSVRHDYG